MIMTGNDELLVRMMENPTGKAVKNLKLNTLELMVGKIELGEYNSMKPPVKFIATFCPASIRGAFELFRRDCRFK